MLPASLGMRPTVTLEDLESATEISNLVLVKLQEECDLGASTLGDDVIPREEPSGSRKLSLPERSFEIGVSHEVFIASCQSPHSFLCQLASEAEILDTITVQLAQTYAGSETAAELENLPEEGDYVCGQFSEDGLWYRAQVLGCEGNNLEVVYVDFGNSEVLPLSSLRVLSENLASYPPMTFECFLSGVESLSGDGQFEQAAADRMLDLIGEGVVTMEIVSTDTAGHLGVALTSSEGVNIGTSLIEAGLASELLQTPLTTPSTATLQSSHSTDITTLVDTPKAAVSFPESEEPIPIPVGAGVPAGTGDPPIGVSLPESDTPIPAVVPDLKSQTLEYATSYPEVTLSPGTRFHVTVASVSSPDDFTCQTIIEGSEDLEREIAAEGYGIGIDSLTVRAPTPGQPVCVCCSRDNTWCRAKITSVDQAPNAISVEYVDLGFSEVLPLERVKCLKQPFASAQPPRALHCSLQPLTERDLGPSALETEDAWELVWPQSCSRLLVELTRDKEGIFMEVTGTSEEGNFIVKLVDASGEADVDIREAIVAKLREPKALPLDNDTSDDEEFHDALDVESELQLDEVGGGREGGAEEVGAGGEGGADEEGAGREGGADEVGARREGGADEEGARREGGADEEGAGREGGADEEDPAVEQFQDASDVMDEVQLESPGVGEAGGDTAPLEPLEDSAVAEPSVMVEGVTQSEPVVAEEDPTIAGDLTVEPPAEDTSMAETAGDLTVEPPAVVEDPTIAEPPEATDNLTVEPPSTMAEPPEATDRLTLAEPPATTDNSETAELPATSEHVSTADSPLPPEDPTTAELSVSDVDSTIADRDTTQQSEATHSPTTAPVEDSTMPGSTATHSPPVEDSLMPGSTATPTTEDMTATESSVTEEQATMAEHSFDEPPQQEGAEMPMELGGKLSEPSVLVSTQGVAAAGRGEDEERPSDSGGLSDVATGGDELVTDTAAATEASVEQTASEDTASEPHPPEPLPPEPHPPVPLSQESPVAVERAIVTQDVTTPADVSSDPVTGDTDVSTDPVTGDTDVSTDPVTGDTDVSSDPVTGDTDVGTDPVTGDTDVGSDPVTGDTDVGTDPVTGDTDVGSDPVTGDTDVGTDPVTGDTDVGSDPVTGDTDVGSDPVTGDTDVGSDPVTGDTDVGSDPVTGDTDVGSDPVTGDTDVSSDPVTGDTDVSSDPVTGDTDGSDPVTGDTDVGSDPVTGDRDVGSDPVTGDTDVGSDPVTGDTDVGSDPVTGDRDVGSDPVTGDTDVGSDPVTGDTDVGSDPVTGDTDVGSDPVTGDTDVGSDPVTGDTDISSDPVTGDTEGMELKQAEESSDSVSTSRQSPATEEKEESVLVMEREEGGETMPGGEEEGVEPVPVGEEEGVEPVPVTEEGEEESTSMTEEEGGAVNVPVAEWEEEGAESHPQAEAADCSFVKEGVPSDSEGRSPGPMVSVCETPASLLVCVRHKLAC